MRKNKTLLKIENLVVRYGAVEALKGINMEVNEGEIVAILGANGAGKTSTLRTISGLVESSGGSIVLGDQDITKTEAEKISAMGIGQSPEGRQVFRDFTVEENLKIGAFTIKDKAQIESNFNRVYGYFPVLKERKNQSASTLSGGEQQMLAIARALMGSPKILLLDEPSLGLAPLIVQDIMDIVKEIKQEGTTVIIVEQNAAQTLKIADYAYVLELGQVKMHGEASKLKNDPHLIEAYLGAH
ncbi:ABC transporter ATP-binding protein [Fusibacter tunisiensis]|uniref:Branched-chain amino acid transport system ATP-binding protein n=1 Tax=Fusibacter tunisiensis TaxID=1008308 RepID=A0ABS2MRJ7_9FIRM|nr:ABC transporter ATP-binding protein [Fusibacter tunisiensis]MBM7562023.1 branched-chain amino acid transport system ATP-binding protein [Fusibacter tunisiensis]